MTTLRWLARRAYLRSLWARRRLTWGAFLAGLADAPAWMSRDTAPWWVAWTPRGRALRRVLRDMETRAR